MHEWSRRYGRLTRHSPRILGRPRQWSGCWLALNLSRELALDGFWAERLGPSRKGTRWHQVLLLLTAYRRQPRHHSEPGRARWRWLRHPARCDDARPARQPNRIGRGVVFRRQKT